MFLQLTCTMRVLDNFGFFSNPKVLWWSFRLYLDGKASTREQFLLTLRRALERSGCSMIKFGQWLSMRPDHFPADLCECLSHLRQDVPAHPLAYAQKKKKKKKRGKDNKGKKREKRWLYVNFVFALRGGRPGTRVRC
jgi:predicted unusual protein kinase regulating ubiquinone biosynthesis (AarF/ABC1/UbiB family)